MLKKTINYTDYNGNSHSEDFYFNLSQAEIVEMEYGTKGRLTNMIQDIINANNEPEIIRLFKDLVLRAYGVKSDDGKRFIKSEELRTEFSQTEAYTTLFMELATDAKAASDFVNGILPNNASISNPVPAPAV